MIVVMMSVTVTTATYSLSDLYLPQIKKMPYFLLQSHFLVLVVCNFCIRLHPLNEKQEKITLLEEGKL